MRWFLSNNITRWRCGFLLIYKWLPERETRRPCDERMFKNLSSSVEARVKIDQIRSIGADNNLKKGFTVESWLFLLPASLSDIFSMLAVFHVIDESWKDCNLPVQINIGAPVYFLLFRKCIDFIKNAYERILRHLL